MSRLLLILTVALGLIAVAPGQGGAPLPTAAEQLELLSSNRTLLEQLLESGVQLSDAETSLDRVEASRSAIESMTAALTSAKDQPPGRIEELADHLGTLWDQGFTPSLEVARSEIRPGSPEFERLEKLESGAVAELGEVTRTLESAPASVRVKLEKLRPLPPQSPSAP